MKILKTPILLLLLLLCSLSCDNTPKKIVNFTELEGTLDQAIATAKEKNKYLLVISSLEGCEACNVFFQILHLNTKVKEELAKHFLVYESDHSKKENRYLLSTFNCITSPTCFIFSPKGELVNISGNKAIASKTGHNILKKIRTGKILDLRFDKRISLPTQETIGLINTILKAYRVYKDPKQNTAYLKKAFTSVQETTVQYPYFFNHYLAAEIASKLHDSIAATKHYSLAKTFNDNYSKYLYQDLFEELEQYKQH